MHDTGPRQHLLLSIASSRGELLGRTPCRNMNQRSCLGQLYQEVSVSVAYSTVNNNDVVTSGATSSSSTETALLVPAPSIYTNKSDLVQELRDPSDDNAGGYGEDSC